MAVERRRRTLGGGRDSWALAASDRPPVGRRVGNPGAGRRAARGVGNVPPARPAALPRRRGTRTPVLELRPVRRQRRFRPSSRGHSRGGAACGTQRSRRGFPYLGHHARWRCPPRRQPQGCPRRPGRARRAARQHCRRETRRTVHLPARRQRLAQLGGRAYFRADAVPVVDAHHGDLRPRLLPCHLPDLRRRRGCTHVRPGGEGRRRPRPAARGGEPGPQAGRRRLRDRAGIPGPGPGQLGDRVRGCRPRLHQCAAGTPAGCRAGGLGGSR
jgi:hypothetical protein